MTDIERNLFHEFCRTFNRATDIGLSQTPHPDDDFRNALRHNNAVFAAFKTHRLQNDVARQLTDSNGNLKTFEQWKNDVRTITSHQCDRWLRTEYDTAVLRARQAANWQQFLREADVLPNLRWVPSTSPHPGNDHMKFWNTILPISHPFWNQHRPGDRWNCKCDLQSTDKEPTTVPDAAGGHDPHPGLDSNPGIDAKLFSDTHPYIAKAYPGAREAVDRFIQQEEERENVDTDKEFGQRLKISREADKTELKENKRAAKALLNSFPDMDILIRPHIIAPGHKNPEFEINGIIADRKGIESEKGVAAAFNKALEQGCRAIVIDLDMNMKEKILKTIKLSGKIYNRHRDFEENIMKECYVIYRGKAVLIDAGIFVGEDTDESRRKIKEALDRLI